MIYRTLTLDELESLAYRADTEAAVELSRRALEAIDEAPTEQEVEDAYARGWDRGEASARDYMRDIMGSHSDPAEAVEAILDWLFPDNDA